MLLNVTQNLIVSCSRVPFTAHDDEALCYYIARVLPDKAAGGRLGLEIYKKLVKTVGIWASIYLCLTVKIFFLQSHPLVRQR